MDTNEIYKTMNEEFMGHGVNGVIIAKPLGETAEEKTFASIWREYATLKLEQEAKFFWIK